MSRDDLRIGRISTGGRLYHVTTTTEGRRPLFEDLTCARLLVSEMRRLQEQHLPDHLHWLFRLHGPLPLSQVIKLLKGRSSKRVGEWLGTRQTIWQRGFHDHALRREEELQKVARYIVANPLRAGLVRSVRLYSHWDAVWV
ncbi:transposase [Pseudomonas otitidis]|uniref:REP-associated tyrosine transposase n=1 Tax=Metapseudomonas otitidis TaxID=319939 RepID=UPI0024475A72|nr:transposase [Pseudomonas otitidis]MDH1106284.1 transposase [Pseudomonas otitidis]MDH1159380.1 transposase [Pseudomonas otitidis]MDH1165622.1 transposase [Pseudomonas otitidis]